ncbi:MAG: rhodanese-like domain-containing protein, partial [Verrucomicrobiota bacterium]
MYNSSFQRVLLVTAYILTCQSAPAITADALVRALGRSEPIKLIDLRPQLRFQAGSIPGAMNIPASVILEKQLPPLAHAVLFDDGLGTIDVSAIAATLNQRPGWKADVLVGGYAAWHALQNAPDTAAAGLHLERTQQIGYANLNQL